MQEYSEQKENSGQNKSKEEKIHFDPNAAVNAFENVAQSYMNWQQTIAANETERERIKAEKEKAIKQIEATKEILMTYLNKSFDERTVIFKKNFEAIDVAIASNNMEALAITIQSVNALAAQSPFKALADVAKVRQSLLNGDEIEI